ncbi:MAG: DUF6197 family protein [Stellaceae bacterium]
MTACAWRLGAHRARNGPRCPIAAAALQLQEVIMESGKTGSIDTHALAKLAIVQELLASEDRWCKGSLRDRRGRHCLLGALDAAHARHLLAPIVLNSAREVGGKRYWRIESFNDDRRTTHADILRVLYCAAGKIAAGATSPAAPRPRRRGYGQAWRALWTRTAAVFSSHLTPAVGGFAARLQPALVAK